MDVSEIKLAILRWII